MRAVLVSGLLLASAAWICDARADGAQPMPPPPAPPAQPVFTLPPPPQPPLPPAPSAAPSPPPRPVESSPAAGAAPAPTPPAPAPPPAAVPPPAGATTTPAPATPPVDSSPAPPTHFPSSNGTTADLLAPTYGNPHPSVTPGGSQRASGIVSGVFGVLFVGSAFAWSSVAKSLNDRSDGPGLCVNDVCTASGLTDRANARTFADIATASVLGGAALVATGVLLFVTAPTAPKEPPVALQVLPGGVRLRASW